MPIFKLKHTCIFLIFFFIFFRYTLSQEIELKEITIKKLFLKNLTQDVDYFSPERIESFPYFSPEEIIDYSSSVDLRKRAVFGIQQDISLRGSAFEDTSVYLEGIKINNPQTGHFNLELPLTSADLEEIEIFKNSQRINFILKKPKTEGLLLKGTFGEHALWEKLVSFNFPLRRIGNRISLERKISSGERQDTDFKIHNSSYHCLWEKDNREIEFLFGYTKRDFGANSFYSIRFPHQEEHTDQRFFLLKGGLQEDSFKLTNTLYFKRHTDKYILDRHNPQIYTNYHTTYLQGIKFVFGLHNGLFSSFDIGREKITSTRLGNHKRIKKVLSLGIKDRRIEDFIFNFSGDLEHYKNWKNLKSFYLSCGYFLKDNLKLRFSFERISRVPSFTELYYSDPANIGNQDLGVQRSNNFEYGIDYFLKDKLTLSLSSFLRRQKDTIDWVKNSPFDRWRAENIGDLKAYGFDFNFEIKLSNTDFRYTKEFSLNSISLGYTFLNLDRENLYNFSKYIFDYNRHKIVGNFKVNFRKVSLNLISNSSKPVNRRGYTTFDLKVTKKLSNLTLTLEGINIFNRDYEEMRDIKGSGRWYKVSIVYPF